GKNEGPEWEDVGQMSPAVEGVAGLRGPFARGAAGEGGGAVAAAARWGAWAVSTAAARDPCEAARAGRGAGGGDARRASARLAFGRDRLDAEHQVAELGQRHPDVLEQQRALLLHRGDRDAAGGDEGLTFIGVVGEIALGGRVGVADLLDPTRLHSGVGARFVG